MASRARPDTHRGMLVLVLTLAAVAVTAFVMRQRWAAAAAPEQHDAASTPSSMPSSRIPGKALAEAIVQANHGLSSEEIWSRPAIEPSTAIAGFPAHPSIACFACFEAEHRLNKGVVRKLYTNEDVPNTYPMHRVPKPIDQSSCLSRMRLSRRASSSSSTSRSPRRSAGRAGRWPLSTRRCGRDRGTRLVVW